MFSFITAGSKLAVVNFITAWLSFNLAMMSLLSPLRQSLIRRYVEYHRRSGKQSGGDDEDINIGRSVPSSRNDGDINIELAYHLAETL